MQDIHKEPSMNTVMAQTAGLLWQVEGHFQMNSPGSESTRAKIVIPVHEAKITGYNDTKIEVVKNSLNH